MVREGSFPFCCLSLFVAYPFLLALQIDITAVYMYLVF